MKWVIRASPTAFVTPPPRCRGSEVPSATIRSPALSGATTGYALDPLDYLTVFTMFDTAFIFLILNLLF